MISFRFGDVEEENATVKIDGVSHAGHFKRDSEGHIIVTVDTFEPGHGEDVELTFHTENDGRYRGSIDVSGDEVHFKKGS